MSTPLSPLTSSRQNSRGLSPASFHSKTEHSGIDETMANNEYSENTFSSPLKTVISNTDIEDPQEDMDYPPTHESHEQNVVEDDAESFQVAPSSPFQFDGRDETVDFQMLQRQQQRQLSPIFSERSTTPRKRSYENVPDEQNADEDLDERHTKDTNRRDQPEINVYADEDARPHNEQNLVEGAGQETANSMMEDKHNEGMSTVLREDETAGENENADADDVDDAMIDNNDDDELHETMDETCLSTFSAVPNADMTSFARLRGESPTKAMRNFQNSPAQQSDARSVEPSTPNSSKRPYMKNSLIDIGSPIGSPTPRKREARDIGNPSDTPNLLDLADQHTFFPRKRYSVQNARYSPSRRSPLRNVGESIRSPSKTSLLDFDIPPVPTPRSIPTVTPRELESLKSGFMSEISSLKATLSGKEAEVASLKQAVADAERRVGEAMEEVRHEAASKEALEIEQVEWQRRGQEMEDVLQTVRATIVEGEREREQLTKKVEEVEKSKEQLEGRVVELESQLEAARTSAPSEPGASEAAPNTKTAEKTANEVQDAVEKVARELHALYKGKHETKVAALKKSYESRWEKRVREAEKKAKSTNEENERLKMERDAAMSEAANPNASMMARENDDHEAERHVLEAQMQGLQQEMAAIKADSERMRSELEMERAEKGELVAAVDEWLSMQQPQQQTSGPSSPREEESGERTTTPEPMVEDFRRSIGRSGPSGIRPPSTGEKRIPKIPAPASRHGRGNSGGKSGIAVFTPGRSGIMGSIERMGRGA
ncbi:hypothetical protein ASPWEDRAFT_43821 [Aspergillus wentii DTO 134E9]|uniref:Uncharacterized protein n=1 Tax=Aspergillus wentii DTO 134E9 TaxID=1073089 RepID=A0A1L9RA73_ASPWE|nr:uncharacterized protein ASPWEDRAFT_43821 [Aspergillus wentii DTO 134E9]KAI9934414.1 hypothetical protein MW887_000028 [Aspergillus wentii]OJJ31824.1 hypothetical protein ASPWEDRAFT_43821 [Aspergillus wentii DTO 134E9]